MVITSEVWKRFYTQILRIRRVEERIAEAYPNQEIRCPVHLSIGQEAVAVGVCTALQNSDEVMSGHRSHAHYLAKGGDLKAMLCELMGKSNGCAFGLGGSMHLIDKSAGFRGAVPIVGSTIPIATGLAFQHKLDHEGRVVVVFLGEGATEEGVFVESLNFASVKNLPIVFVVENNLYSVYSPLSVRQSAKRSITLMSESHGVRASAGDGNKVDTVFELAKDAVQKARMGNGPSVITLDTYRWREHCGPNFDNHIGYRTESEYLEWKERCPLFYASAKVEEVTRDEISRSIEVEIDKAFQLARESSPAMKDSGDLEKLVFARG